MHEILNPQISLDNSNEKLLLFNFIELPLTLSTSWTWTLSRKKTTWMPKFLQPLPHTKWIPFIAFLLLTPLQWITSIQICTAIHLSTTSPSGFINSRSSKWDGTMRMWERENYDHLIQITVKHANIPNFYTIWSWNEYGPYIHTLCIRTTYQSQQ